MCTFRPRAIGQNVIDYDPIAHVIELFHGSTKRGEPFQANVQKVYDKGFQIALRNFGE